MGHNSSKAEGCGKDGKDDMWREVRGCDPRTGDRVEANDLRCDSIPVSDRAGYCDCKDGIPRYFTCKDKKKKCKAVCLSPPPKTKLSQAFSNYNGLQEKATPASSGKHKAAVLYAVIGVIATCTLALISHLTKPRTDERKQLMKLIESRKLA